MNILLLFYFYLVKVVFKTPGNCGVNHGMCADTFWASGKAS